MDIQHFDQSLNLNIKSDYFQFKVKDYNANNEEARESIENIINSFVDEFFWQEYTYSELSIPIEQHENKNDKKDLNNILRMVEDLCDRNYNVTNLGYQRTINEIHNIINSLSEVTEIIIVDYIKMALFHQIMNPDSDTERLMISDALGVFIPHDNVKLIHEMFFNEDDNYKVGDWIILCPDKIKSYSLDFISSFEKQFTGTTEAMISQTPEFVLKKFSDATYIYFVLMKFILLHEVGHAVFKNVKEGTDIDQIRLVICEEEMAGILNSEAIANLFAVHSMAALEQPIIRILHFYRGFEKIDVLLKVEAEHIIKAGLMNQLITKNVVI